MREEKTNVMRLLEQKKVPYTPHQYAHSEGEAVDGATVAGLIGKDPAAVFKTLVTRGAAKANYVFVIPVLAELDLKKAAKAVGEKSIEMIPVRRKRVRTWPATRRRLSSIRSRLSARGARPILDDEIL